MALAVACVTVGAGYLAYAAGRDDRSGESDVLRAGDGGFTAVQSGARIVFRHTDTADHGTVAWAPLESPAKARAMTGIKCDVVHAGRGGGIWLWTKRGGLLLS